MKTHAKPSVLQDNKVLYLTIGLIAILLISCIALAYQNIFTLRDNAQQVIKSRIVLNELDQLLSIISKAESSVQAYLITGNDEELLPYKQARNHLPQQVRFIARITRDIPSQQLRIETLNSLVNEEVKVMNSLLEVRQDQGFSSSKRLFEKGDGDAEMAALHLLVDEMRLHEQVRLNAEAATGDRNYRIAIISQLVILILSLIIIGAFILILRHHLKTREMAQASLNDQKEWFRTSLQSIGDAIITTDTQGNVTFMNRVAEVLTGWNTQKAEGLPLTEILRLLDEKTRNTVENPATRALREGRSITLASNTILVNANGSEKFIDNIAAPIYNKDTMIGVVLVFRDISQRQIAEKLVSDSEERFRALVEATSVVVWTALPNGETHEDSPSWRAYTGQTIDEFRGSGWLNAVHPDDRERTKAYWKSAVGDCSTYEVEYRLHRSDGTYHWTVARGVPVLEADGTVREWVGMNIDIHEQKRITEALRNSEKKFLAMANSIPQLAWITRADGYITWYNKRWYDYTGKTLEEMEGWGWESVHDPAELPRVLKHFKDSIKKGEPWEDTFPLRRHDGEMRWHLSRAMPLYDDAGNIVSWFGTNTDITELMQLEESLKRADRQKDEFLATLAHELRNPLAPISNALRILKSGEGDIRKFQSIHEMIERQHAQLVRLIDDLLDISRITLDKISLVQKTVDVSHIINMAIETSMPLLHAGNHEISLKLPDEAAYIYADESRIAQALFNLISNAVKYSDAGTPIEIIVDKNFDKDEITISVRDRGIGIPKDVLPNVFEMFIQADSSLERSGSGLGIGLTLVRQMVEMHKGTVTAYSEGRNLGSEFIISLPAAGIQNLEKDAPPEVETIVPESIHGRKILVVDDYPDAADSMKLYLEHSGHDVVIAKDGKEALEQAFSHRPEVMLMDIGLPKINGYEVARHIRDEPWGQDVLLIALTGWGNERDKDLSDDAGFDHHLVKPPDLDVLEDIINRGTSARSMN